MKYEVRQWKRTFLPSGSYRDTFPSLGNKMVTFCGSGDSTIAKVGNVDLTGVFKIEQTKQYMDLIGFTTHPVQYTHYRCYKPKVNHGKK
jgi:hypothetical protein